MRKLISTILCIILLLGNVVSVHATTVVASGQCGTDATYELTSDGVLTITGSGCVGNLLDFAWDFENIQVKELVLSEGITELAYNLFTNFTNLKTIHIPNSLEYIPFENVFAGCTNLENFIVSNEHSNYLAEGTLLYNKDKTTLYFVSRTTTGEFHVPDQIKTIDRGAIAECHAITKVILSPSVQAVEYKAIADCSALEAIEVQEGNQYFYSQDGVLFSRNKSSLAVTLTAYPSGKTGDYIVPKITKIGDAAFYGARYLENVTISDGVFNIGMYAFEKCYNLKSVTMTDSVYNMSSGVFSECENLTSVILSDNITSLYEAVFYSCSSLAEITLPSNLTFIGLYCFQHCTNLKNVTFPDSLANIMCYAFNDCDSLTEIVLPDSLKSTGNVVFAECDNLETVTMTDSVVSMGNNMFMNCPKLKHVTLSNQLTKIGNYDFYRCESLETIDLPDNLSTLGNYAFWGCSSLEAIELPESVTSIGKQAFSRCSNLKEFTTPSWTTELTPYYLYNCTSLHTVVLNEGLTTIDTYAFAFCQSLSEINVPATVTSIGSKAFYNCTSLRQLYIPATVTSISSDAFRWCDNLTLKVEKGSYAHQFAIDNEIPFVLTVPETPEDLFSDVKETDWFYTSVKYIYHAGIMSGDAGMFHPEGAMTRAMMVTTLYRLAGYPDIYDFTAMNYFDDVPKNNDWYVDAVNWAYENRITTGYTGTKLFGTHDSVTREQIATFLYRFAEYENFDTTVRASFDGLENADKVNDYAQDAMQWAIGIGLISGIETSVNGVMIHDLAPQDTATRAQMATMLMRFMEYHN